MKAVAYERNGESVTRDAFYAIACDPQRSVAVQACAGAGKTWMLVSRMLRALLDGCAPHEILAITFTKKAAGEMRQRLQEWLQEFADKDLPALEQELLARGVHSKDARRQCTELQKLYGKTLEADRPVQIRTFHGWFAALLANAPLALLEQLGLPTNYELLQDDTRAIREVWRHFLHTVVQSAELRADYQASVACYGRTQTHKALHQVLNRRIEFMLADAAGVIDASVESMQELFPDMASDVPEVEDAALVLLRRERETLLLAARALGQYSAPTIATKGQELEMSITGENPDGMLEALLTKGEPRKFSPKIEGLETIRHAQALCLRALEARRQHQAWLHQQRMARLTRALVAQFSALKRERGWVDMNDVEHAAQVMLSDPVMGAWVQERLDVRVRHLLVDEFQDTNPLQWQALQAWLAGYAGAGGGQQRPSVFIVGDPKQSIYRFRRAEPQIFLAAQNFVRYALDGEVLACDHTRRNATSVIAVINQIMQAAQARGEYTDFRLHTTESSEAGQLLRLPPVFADSVNAYGSKGETNGGVGGDVSDDAATLPCVWRDSLTQPRYEVEETLRMRESTQAARWIAARIADGIPAREIMVLARKRDRLVAMQQALCALHIDCVQPEKMVLSAQPEVQDILALLDVLVSHEHNLSLARVLKSPLFGVDDEALVQIALLAEQTDASWFDVLQDNELTAVRCKGVGADLARYQNWVDKLPVHDALQAIYDHRDVPARYAAAASVTQRRSVLSHLSALLVAALQEGGGRYLTPYAFIRGMKRPDVAVAARVDTQAVRLLTVHGAKGLEADVVLLLDTDARAQKAETMGVLMDWQGDQSAPQRFVFLASETTPPPSVAALLQAEQAARRREGCNVLYVAMTRARHSLVLSCTQRTGVPVPGSWWSWLAPSMQEVTLGGRGDVVTNAASQPERPAAVTAPVVLAGLPILSKSADSAGARDGEYGNVDVATAEARQGQAMHQLLEQVGMMEATPFQALAANGWPATRLARLARDFDITVQAAHRAAAMAQRILQGEGAWAWDAMQVERAINEAPLVWQGRSLRIDRLVRRRDAGWWVLDYKSAARPENQTLLRAQLLEYRQAVQALMPGESVTAAFLTGRGRMVVLDEVL